MRRQARQFHGLDGGARLRENLLQMQRSEDQTPDLWRGFYIGVAVMLAVSALYAVLVLWLAGGKHGTFGDMFGGLNTLFSGLAFLGLLLTIHLQRQELQEQKVEIRLAREAHQETADALQAQHLNAVRTAEIQGLNLLIETKRDTLARMGEPTTLAQQERKRATERALSDLEERLQSMIAATESRHV